MAKTEATAQFGSAIEIAKLTIDKVPQTITFAITEATFGVEPSTIGITSSSGLPVTVSSSRTDLVKIVNGVATIVGAGTVSLFASQAGNDTYAAATPVAKEFVIKKGDQVITFPEIGTKTRDITSFELDATSTSGLPVKYSTNSNHVMISTGTVMITGSGRVEITASQTGTDNYNAAAAVTRAFCISPVKPDIFLTGDNSTAPFLTSDYTAGIQWYRGGTAIDGATTATYTVSTSGTYTVVATIEGCASEKSEDKVVTMGTNAPPDPNSPITGVDETTGELSLRCFPNPADTEVIVELNGPSLVTVAFSLKDVLGRSVVQLQTTTNNSKSIDLREVPKGVYFVEAVAEGKKYVTRLVK